MITQNAVFGRSKQKLGGVVTTTWKGKNVVKSKPLTVANPRTANQVGQRDRVTFIVQFYRLIAGVVKPSFKSLAIGMSEFNAFSSENLKNGFITNSGLSITKDWSKFVTGKGTIGATDISTVSASNGSAAVTISYSNSDLPVGASLNDFAYAIVYNVTQDKVGIAAATDMRSDGSIEVTMPSNCATSDVLKCYLSFTNNAASISGNSSYKTKTV